MAIDESKIDTELNLALQTEQSIRDKSMDLNIGYSDYDDEWELIIRYTGNLEEVANSLGIISYIELLNGFGIIRIKSSLIDALSNNPAIIFIEKPKSLYQERSGNIIGYNESCINLLQSDTINLTGKGICVCVIDSGIDIYHPDFIDNNKSKIFELWDQSVNGNPPDNYLYGTIYSNEDITSAIRPKSSDYESLNIQTYDTSGHGTGVASVIVACAPDINLFIVKLATETQNGNDYYARTSSLILGIDYAIKRSIQLKLPMVINISFGNNYGDHSSNSIIEEYIDSVSSLSRISIVTGMGNDGNTGRHFQTNLLENNALTSADIIIDEYETSINVQIWRNYSDDIDIYMYTPDGRELGPFNLYQEVMRYNLSDMTILAINGYPSPINANQETYISIIPNNSYIQSGIWSIRFDAKRVVDGRIDIWLPVIGSTSTNIRFINPAANTSMTIPSTSRNIISVAAYNPISLSYAPFSGRGYTRDNLIKPDIAAPGVNIDVAAVGGGYIYVSGTSFAAPFVSAAAALLMEWGITDNNDVFLYGEKIKAYLISGARKLPGINNWPNELLGWGALCVADSIPN